MQTKFTFFKNQKISSRYLVVLTMLLFFGNNVMAQFYNNGVLSTGATTLSGVAAPAGTTWSECQNVTGNLAIANTSAGFSAGLTAGNSIADDFTVPAGPSWNLTKITVYAYSTGSTGTVSPFNDLRVRIHSSNPLSGPTTILFGDLTTNRLAASTSTNVFRIFSTVVFASASGTTRNIWRLEANASVTLAPGTYWLEYQTGTALASNFSPPSSPVGVRTLPGYNAIQKIGAGAWVALVDDGVTNAGGAGGAPVAMDMPFRLDYTTGACSGTPTPGNTIASLPTVCAGLPISLSLQNSTNGSGVTYQWQTASLAAGPWTNVPTGGTSPSLSTSLTATTFYRCLVTCSGNTGTSAPVQVLLTPVTGCYCTPTVINCNLDDRIANVTFGTLNNTSGTTCTNGYSNYTNTTPATTVPDVIAGGANPISVTVGPGGTEFVGAWIDYNKNGNFEASEFQLLGSGNGVTINSAINAPATALTGVTRMRLRVQFNTAVLPTQSCAQTSGFGEVEDYNVNIVPCIPITVTTQPANATVICGGNTTISVALAGSLPTYQWQYRTLPTNPWINVTNLAPYSGATTATLNITNANTSLNGYQYRVLYAGACTSPDFTNFGTLTVNPIVAVVNPVSATLCQGGIQQLTITNIASPAPGSTVVNSATLNLNVPDNNPVGVNSTITIPALPVGAVVVGARVRLNVVSTWLGDLNVNLKAPNNQILNLSHNLSVTNGNATGGGSFVNTVIGSAFTTVLHTATSPDNPHTGNFKADAGTITVGGITPNVTGFVPTTASWNSLFTTPSGIWTIAIADIFPGADATTFQNWSLTIDYLLGAPATGVYTGPTGTIFTDALATTAYTGTAINTVYVKPTTTGVNNYSVIVTDAACASLPLIIPVTMYAPVTASTPLTLANTTVCATTNASFALGGTLAGGPLFNHQFQVRTPGSTTWTNVTNGTVYGGATTSTLTLTGTPASFNGNQYRDSIYTGNACGFLISPVATLTVNTTPVVTISAAPVTKLFPSLTSTLTAAVSSATAPLTYQWFRNGTAVTGATTNKTVVNIDGLGVYTVRVGDANGCISAAGASTPASIAITDSVTTDRLFIYPSPNSGQFQVRWYTDLSNGSLVPGLLNIYDSKGSRVFTGVYTIGNGYKPMTVDLGVHGKGVYRVDLLDFNGNRLKTGSVMVF
jgi:subtilisin-like proprotein convertase family protein